MKKIYNILIGLIGFILITGLVYATVAKDRKSTKLPWQGTNSLSYDSAHNVGNNYIPESRFSFDKGTIAGNDSVILDNVTGLYWQSNGTATGIMDWESAKSYCADLELGLYTDWRLPNLKELQSIVDLSKNNYAIDTTYFTVSFNTYWSSTTYALYTDYAWIVYFYYGGKTTHMAKTNTSYVRCIR